MSALISTRLPASLRPVLSWHRPLLVFAAANAVLVVVAVVGLLADPRVLGGAPIWLKPLKFAVSFVLYGVVLAWMISLLRRRPRWGYWLGVLIIVTGVAEMAVIVGQVVRGQQSHFNVTTTVDATLWYVMAVTIVLLWLATLGVAILLLRERIADPALAAGIRLGLGVALLGMLVGVLMGTPTADQRAALAAGETTVSGAHSVGVTDGGPGLALTGWSTTGGDLRVGHFVGMHAAQALPLLALALGALAGRWTSLRDERVRVRVVAVGAATWLGLTLALTWQALRGQPLLAPDGLTLAVLAGLLAAAAIGAAAALRAGSGSAHTAR